MDAILVTLAALWEQAIDIWTKGGWCMPLLAGLSFILFALGIHINLRLSAKRHHQVSEELWRRWIDVPARREGAIGRLLDHVSGAASVKDQATAFSEVRATELAPFRRDLRVMRICVAAAPLLGLLGTVTGMLATFGALASGSGGEEQMGMVSQGISAALITTETGLVIAIPGLFFRYHLNRKFEEYGAFLAHVETVCTQKLYRRLRKQGRAA